MEAVTDFIFLDCKTTVDRDCSNEIRRYLFLGEKAMICLVVIYGCESWTIKKAECQTIGALNCGIGEDS